MYSIISIEPHCLVIKFERTILETLKKKNLLTVYKIKDCLYKFPSHFEVCNICEGYGAIQKPIQEIAQKTCYLTCPNCEGLRVINKPTFNKKIEKVILGWVKEEVE